MVVYDAVLFDLIGLADAGAILHQNRCAQLLKLYNGTKASYSEPPSIVLTNFSEVLCWILVGGELIAMSPCSLCNFVFTDGPVI